MLDNVKVNVDAARDDTSRCVSANPPPDIAGETAGQLHELEEDSGAPQTGRQLPTPAEAIEQYQAKAIELIAANVNATLDYARRPAGHEDGMSGHALAGRVRPRWVPD